MMRMSYILVWDTQYLVGLGTVGGRMMTLANIERPMSLDGMGLVAKAVV